MKFRLLLAGFLLTGWISTTATAQLVPFSTDFTSTGTAYPTADETLIGDGWTFYHTQPPGPPVPGSDYFGAAPNGTRICSMAAFEENSYLNVFSDYENEIRLEGNFPTFAYDNSVFQERDFSPEDAASGDTWTFTFEYKHADEGAPTGSTTTAAYIRVFDSVFNLLEEQTFPTSAVNPSFPGFDPGSVVLKMNPDWDKGGKIQFGFTSTSIAFEGSGVFYDNVLFTNDEDPPQFVLGDANDDGELNNLDITAFVLALTQVSMRR